MGPNVEVVSFDRFDRPNQIPSFLALESYFGNHGIMGLEEQRRGSQESNALLVIVVSRNYKKECHFLHGSSNCTTNSLDLIEKSAAGVTLTSTGIELLEDTSIHDGRNTQWASLLEKGCIKNTVCFQEEKRLLDVDYGVAKWQHQVTHNFCFAANTGVCSAINKTVPIMWDKDDFCPDWLHPHFENGAK